MSVGLSVGAGLAIAGGIGAAASVGSAVIGAHAAGNAADKQIAAAGTIQNLAEQQKIASDSSYGDILLREPQLINDAAQSAKDDASRGVGDASVILNNQLLQANTAAQAQHNAARGLLQPYENAGNFGLQGAQAAAGAPAFTADNFKQLDPGFDFRMQQATKALQQSAIAKGSGLSGATLKALDRYSQDYGSSEFGNAFNRYQSANQQRYAQMMGLVNVGQTATGQEINSGENLVNQGMQAGQLFATPQAQNAVNLGVHTGDISMNSAQFNANQEFAVRQAQQNARLAALGIQGNAITGGANAAAAGTVGAANAWSGGLQTAGNDITQAIILGNLFKQPTVAPSTVANLPISGPGTIPSPYAYSLQSGGQFAGGV